MAMPPMAGGIPPAGMRQGTSKVVPVVVSAGLAVGVFCGLLFGLGTGDENEAKAGGTGSGTATARTGPQAAAAATNEVTNFKSGEQKPDARMTESGVVLPAGTGGGTGSGSGSAAVADNGTGTGSGSDAGGEPPESEPGKVVMTFQLTPPEAVVTVDGNPVVNGTYVVDLGDKKKVKVRVVAKAEGFRSMDRKVDVNKDETFQIKLPKARSSGGGGGGTTRPPRDRDRDKDKDDKDPPGGLIDL
jgi:hypothetical protein